MDLPEGSKIVFEVGPNFDPLKMAELLRLAGRTGLSCLTDVSDFTREAELRRHLEATKPTSRESFIGKEHLHHIADQVGQSRQQAGRLYKQLVSPRAVKRWSSDFARSYSPEQLGLVVSFRRKEGFPEAPRGVIQNQPPQYRRHSPPQVDPNLIIQVGGIIDLANNPERTSNLSRFKEGTTEFLAQTAEYLQAAIANTATPFVD